MLEVVRLFSIPQCLTRCFRSQSRQREPLLSMSNGCRFCPAFRHDSWLARMSISVMDVKRRLLRRLFSIWKIQVKQINLAQQRNNPSLHVFPSSPLATNTPPKQQSSSCHRASARVNSSTRSLYTLWWPVLSRMTVLTFWAAHQVHPRR
jgi:hypothetical protein